MVVVACKMNCVSFLFFVGVLGNITHLRVLDISHNKLKDLNSEPGLFRLPENMSEIYLSHNNLRELPWKNIKAATELKTLDVAYNNFNEFSKELTAMVLKNVSVLFEGNQLKKM